VKGASVLSETVLTVSSGQAGKTVENGFVSMPWSITGLKPGVNETTLEAEGELG